jgi:putative transposase
LTEAEQQAVLTCLQEDRFQDSSPAQVYAALLDEGQFHCSIRTLYGLLEARGESRERRDQLTHPPYQKPELLATQANQLWSWDSTKLRGPAKWTCYHLYVILDVFSRFVVGWMMAYRESAELAKRISHEQPVFPQQRRLAGPGESTRGEYAANAPRAGTRIPPWCKKRSSRLSKTGGRERGRKVHCRSCCRT